MATVIDRQEFTFQAEIKQVLHLLSHSLYQSREIALRELISFGLLESTQQNARDLGQAMTREDGVQTAVAALEALTQLDCVSRP